MSSRNYPLNAPRASALAALVSAMTIAIYAPDIAIIVPIAENNKRVSSIFQTLFLTSF